MTLDAPDLDALRALRVRQEVVDALYRFAAGQDLKDRDLFLSAFAPDATLDFTQPAERFGADIPIMTGRNTIEGILDTLAPLVTSHTVTNPRVADLGGGRAGLTALVEAQHVSRTDPQRHLLLKNVYDVTLVPAGDRYVVESMTIRTLWHDGDPSVLFGTASPRADLVRAADASWIDQGSGVELAPLRVVGTAAEPRCCASPPAGGRRRTGIPVVRSSTSSAGGSGSATDGSRPGISCTPRRARCTTPRRTSPRP